MIIVNNFTGKTLETENKSEAAREIGYARMTIHRWSWKYAKKDTYNNNFTIYFCKALYFIEKSLKV